MSPIQSDSPNQLSLPHTNSSGSIVEFVLLAGCTHFLSSPFLFSFWNVALCEMTMWPRALIALLHIECTISVFTLRTLLHPFPRINLSQVLSSPPCSYVPRLWLICLCSHVIKSCQSPRLPTYNSSYLIIFQRLYGHWASIIPFPARHHMSLLHSNVFCLQEWNMEMSFTISYDRFINQLRQCCSSCFSFSAGRYSTSNIWHLKIDKRGHEYIYICIQQLHSLFVRHF